MEEMAGFGLGRVNDMPGELIVKLPITVVMEEPVLQQNPLSLKKGDAWQSDDDLSPISG